MNIYRTTCAALNADLHELLEQIEKVVQAASLGSGLQGRATAQLSSRGGLQARQRSAALPQQVCGFVVLCFSRRRNWAALVEILARYRGDLGRRRKINDGFRTFRWGTPEVGGLATWQAQAILRRLENIDFIGMDVVEVSPVYDTAEITALAAATIVWEYLALIALSQ